MAGETANVGIKLSAEGVTQVEEALRKITSSMKGMDSQANTTGATFKKIAGYVTAYFSVRAIANFIKDTTKLAMEEESAMKLMANRLESVGISYASAKDDVDKFLDSMVNLGRDDEEVALAMSKLATNTRDLTKAIDLTKLASDLAASGFGTLEENADNLQKILAGRGSYALRAYNIKMQEGVSITEQLSLVQGKVTQTTEEWAKTAEGKATRMKVQWEEVKEGLGKGFLITLTNLSDAFNNFYNETGKGAATWGYQMGKILNVYVPTLFSEAGIKGVFGKIQMGMANWIESDTNGIKTKLTKGQQAIVDGMKANAEIYMLEANTEMDKREKAYKESWDLITNSFKTGTTAINEGLAGADEGASEFETAFSSLAKTLTSKMSDGISKIAKLREELSGLADDTNEQLAKSDVAYQQNLTQMARTAQERIKTIEKEEADVTSVKSKGWRDRLAELEAEKQKEKDIISKVGGQVVDIQTEVNKDEFTLAQEAYQKEQQAIKDEAEKNRLLKEKEVLQTQLELLQGTAKITSSGFMASATTKEMGLNAWETSVGDTIFNFDFTGASITDKDAFLLQLQKIVMDTINRAASLKTNGK